MDSSPVSTSYDLTAAVQRQAWDWLFELAQRLELSVEVVDDRGVPALPVAAEWTTATLGRILSNPGSVRLAIVAAIESNSPQSVTIERLQIAGFPLSMSGSIVGALVLARGGAAEARVKDQERLESVGGWLARAVEAHLVSARVESDDLLVRVSALQRLLTDAGASGSERSVMNAFAEALAVWDDLEASCYVEDVRGRLLLEVSLPGSSAPDMIVPSTGERLADGEALSFLSTNDAERWGFGADTPVLIGRLGAASEPWVVVLFGVIRPDDQPRLTAYVDLLRETMGKVSSVTLARANWAILQHLLGAHDQIEFAARDAIDELVRLVGAIAGAILVTTVDGTSVLSVGDELAMTIPARDGSLGDHIATTMPVLDLYKMSLSVRRCDGETFTTRDRQILEGVGGLFRSWLTGVLRKAAHKRDRRAAPRPFSDVLEQMAGRILRDGVDVTMVVMVVPDAASEPGLIQRCVADLRGQLRPSDVAGRLSDGEIAILLTDTSAVAARSAVSRLSRRLGRLDENSAARPTAIGLASCRGGAPVERSLVGAAREDAAGRSYGEDLH